ncbi:hypothetical protein DV711_18315 [Motiliproteus coralliicola]|uniref:Uncharacterized protein n=1 Tax=Motiliproteus coralliicola TaxID=2283196 RepID=A0A369W7U6_9GAMM|nr:hypothetical protein [Motiliproteus coralliicola]RDE18078.1 hypothetical protein DV711_18315 [Motiliproteus coralliicola]
MRHLIFLSLLALSSFAFSNEELLIENPDQVAQLSNVQANLDIVSTAVMACIESGNGHSDCLCQNQKAIIQFNTSVETLFHKYPELINHDLVRFMSSDGEWVTQSLQGISKQAGAGVLSCS